jgi:hypothetical protein
MVSSAPLGLIAGKGGLPRIVCDTAADRGVPVVAVAFDTETSKLIGGCSDVKLLGLGQADKVIRHFAGAGVRHVCLAGKIEKASVFAKIAFDRRTLKLMKKVISSKSDTAIMNVIIEELEGEGFKVVKQSEWLPDLLPKKGTLGMIKPNRQVKADFEFGMKLCRETARRDIGQTIIVKEGVVLAVEAVEGTDAAIERGCALGGRSCVMIKSSRPKQDFRFDIPSVGPDTVKLLAKHKAAGLAVEAERTVVIDRKKVVSICDKAGMAFTAM